MDKDNELSVDKILADIEKAKAMMPPAMQAVTDQGTSHVRELIEQIGGTIEYGSKEWREAWTVATITLYMVFAGSQSAGIKGISQRLIETIAGQFMMLGFGEKMPEIDGILIEEGENVGDTD